MHVKCKHNRRKSICKFCSPHGHIRHVLYERMFQVLGPGHRTTEVLGCNFKDLVKRIERKMKPGMTWANYGIKWELDHRIPIKYKNPTKKQLLERLKATNIKPEWLNVNRSKSNSTIS